MVRCARCGDAWEAVEEAEGSGEAVAAVPEQELDQHVGGEEILPQITAMDRLAAPGRRPPRSTRLVAAWSLTLIILMAAVAARSYGAKSVVRAWPPSGRILASVILRSQPQLNTQPTQWRRHLDRQKNDALALPISRGE